MTLVPIDEIEQSFLSNMERGEQALEAAENDYQRLEVRDAARAAQVITAVMGRRRLVRRFSVLVQRAERAIAQANPPISASENAAQAVNTRWDDDGDVPLVAETNGMDGLKRSDLNNYRAAHNSLSDEEFEELVAEDTDDPMTRKQLKDLAREKREEARRQEGTLSESADDQEQENGRSRHLEQGTGNNERRTPAYILDAVRSVVGEIELDPASSDFANDTIRAKRYYTQETDGLAQDWTSATLWMNPPYGRGDIEDFVNKLVSEVERGAVKRAFVITHNATETRWCRALLNISAAFCLLDHRVDFQTDNDAGGSNAGTLRGQAVFFLGDAVRCVQQREGRHFNNKVDWNWVRRFYEVFSEFGEVCIPWNAMPPYFPQHFDPEEENPITMAEVLTEGDFETYDGITL